MSSLKHFCWACQSNALYQHATSLPAELKKVRALHPFQQAPARSMVFRWVLYGSASSVREILVPLSISEVAGHDEETTVPHPKLGRVAQRLARRHGRDLGCLLTWQVICHKPK